MANKRGLGKWLGVNALIPEVQENEEILQAESLLPLNEIEPNRQQPRKKFDPEKLQALADSIREHGIVQPLIVVKEADYYKIVAGERRWRAAKMLGLKEVPVIIRAYTSLQSDEIALIENLQRENLSPIEEAAGYKQLMDKFGLTQEDVSRKMGKSRPAIANALRLLTLPQQIQQLVENEKISVGHAKVLLGLEHPAEIERVAKEIVSKGLSVRQTEEMLKKKPRKEKKKIETNENIANAILDACNKLERKLGTKVKIHYSAAYKGKIEIAFNDLKQMTRLLEEIENE